MDAAGAKKADLVHSDRAVKPDDPAAGGRRDGEDAESSPPCPLTEAHVDALAADLKIGDFNPGAVNPASVWSMARQILDRVDDDHPSYVPRTTLHKLFESAGTDCIDVAWHFLVRGGALVKFKNTPRGGWDFKLARAEGRDDGITPLPDPAKVFPLLPPAKPAPTASTVRSCRVCGCTDAAACQDDHPASEAGECTWTEPDLCSVCARACEATLKICQRPQSRTALLKALTVARGKGIETFDPPRAKATIADLEKRGALAESKPGKLLASQPA